MSRDPQKTASSPSRQHARNLAVVCAVLSALGLGSARFQRAVFGILPNTKTFRQDAEKSTQDAYAPQGGTR